MQILKAEIKPPQISEETMKEISRFFMKTSVPRIFADRVKEGRCEPNESHTR